MSTPQDAALKAAKEIASRDIIDTGEMAAIIAKHIPDTSQRIAELKRDKERLDWLTQFAEQPTICSWLFFGNSMDMGYSREDKPVSFSVKAKGPEPEVKGKGEDLRGAIDDAMQTHRDPRSE